MCNRKMSAEMQGWKTEGWSITGGTHRCRDWKKKKQEMEDDRMVKASVRKWRDVGWQEKNAVKNRAGSNVCMCVWERKSERERKREREFRQGERRARCLRTNHSHMRLNWCRNQTEKKWMKIKWEWGNQATNSLTHLMSYFFLLHMHCPVISFSHHSRNNSARPDLLQVSALFPFFPPLLL